MSSYEINRPSNFDPSNPMAMIDHAVVCESMMHDIEQFASVNEAVSYEQDIQIGFDKALYDTILILGEYLIPQNPDGTLSEDIMNKRVFLSGALLALKTIHATCDTLKIDTESFHAIWASNGYVKIIGINQADVEGKSELEKNQVIGSAIMANGQAYLGVLDENYLTTIDTLADNYHDLVEPNILKGAYAFILGSAQHAFAGMFRELEARRLIDEGDFEQGVEYISEKPIKVRFIDDDVVADNLDTEIFYSEAEFGISSFFASEIEEQIDSNAEVVEVLRALALTLYATEDDYAGELNEDGEAFFYGSIMALRYGKEHCDALDIDRHVVGSKWRRDRTHAKLYNMEFMPDVREHDIDTQVVKTLQQTELSGATLQLADKIGAGLSYEFTDLAAFKNGLQYTLETYKKTIKSCVNVKISQRVKLATQTLNSDIEKLLNPS